MTQFIPTHFGNLNRILAERPGPFCGGAQPAYVDYFLFETVYNVAEWEPTILDHYPALAAQQEAMKARPNVAEWFANKRPKYANASSAQVSNVPRS